MARSQPFKAECSIKMMRMEYQGDDPAGAMRIASNLIGGLVGGMISGADLAAPGSSDRHVEWTTAGAAGTQRTLEQHRIEQRGPRAARPRQIVRELAHADARDLANRTAYSEREERQAALDHLRELFHQYLAGIGVRGTFQSVWFIRWLDETGQRPADLDLRCMGGLVGQLLTKGYIRTIGHQNDGGNPATNHNSATRPLFEIVKLPDPREP